MRLASVLTGAALALSFTLAGPPAQADEPGTMYVTAGTVHDGMGESFSPGAVASPYSSRCQGPRASSRRFCECIGGDPGSSRS